MSAVKVGVGFSIVTIATYDYLGVGQIVGTDYPEPDVFSNLYTGSGYVHMDRFNRVTTNLWTKDLFATDRDFYDVDISYDRDSNITLVEDNVHVGFDASYTLDNVNRLIDAQEGTWNPSAPPQIDNETRQETWILGQTSLWNIHQLDLNGDGDLTGTGELDENNPLDGANPHFNAANEWTARDVDNDGADDFALLYDDLGELTDDGQADRESLTTFEHLLYAWRQRMRDESNRLQRIWLTRRSQT